VLDAFDGDGCRHDSHRAQVHDPDDEEDRRQAGTTVAAVEAEAQAVPATAANVRGVAELCRLGYQAPAGVRIGPIEAIDGTPVIDIKPVVESKHY